jgi:hypothetical protein
MLIFDTPCVTPAPLLVERFEYAFGTHTVGVTSARLG